MDRFKKFAFQVSRNNTRQCWILKCDIRKFFANIDHRILMEILTERIKEKKLQWLLREIITSFTTDGKSAVGLPLGNLTSQLLVNIYMNEFDQFVKHSIKAKYYIRYADDFVFLSPNREWLEIILPEISNFLQNRLKLELHPKKVSVATLSSGIDFLGWVHFPDHRVLRTATKRRMVRRIGENPTPETIASYRGMLSHGNTFRIKEDFLPDFEI